MWHSILMELALAFDVEMKTISLGALLFIVYMLTNYWLYFRLGPQASPIFGNLVEKEFDYSFSVIVGLFFVGACVLSGFALDYFGIIDFRASIKFVVSVTISYTLVCFALHRVAKDFLRKHKPK